MNASPQPLRRVLIGLVSLTIVAAACSSTDGAAGNERTVSFAGVTITTSGDAGVGLVDPATGQWHLRLPAGGVNSFFFGNPGDYPVAGDWDCNGTDTPGLYRQADGFVYLRNTNTQGNADIRFFFGNPGDVPLAGDFNGDGCDTISIYRPAEGRVFVINALGANEGGLGAAETAYYFGDVGDKPFVGDFDGDGVDTIGLHRESTGLVYFRNSHTQGNADSQFIFGDPGDRMVAADWNNDEMSSPGLFRPSDSSFYLRYSNTQGTADEAFPFGESAWLPVAGVWEPGGDRSVNLTLSSGPEELRAHVEDLYLKLGTAPGIPSGLAAHLSSLPLLPGVVNLAGSFQSATVYGTEVAVVTIGPDVVLAAKDPLWRVVGAKLASLGKDAWYGDEPRMVLVLGGENWPGGPVEDGRADSVHIVSARAGDGKGSITGFWRFTLVEPTYGVDTISHSMQQQPEGGSYPTPPPWVGKPHGPAETLAAVKKTTGLPIEGYLLTGFSGFINIVDSINSLFGVFNATLPWPYQALCNPGDPGDDDPEALDGARALEWARQRICLAGGDTDRQLAHGVLIEAALALVRSGDVSSVPAWLAMMDDFVLTDLPPAALLSLGATAFELEIGKQVTDGSGPGNPFDPALPNVVVTSCVAEPASNLSPYTRTTGPYRTLWSSGRNLWPVYVSFFADLADGFIDNPVAVVTPIVDPSVPPTPGVTCHEANRFTVDP